MKLLNKSALFFACAIIIGFLFLLSCKKADGTIILHTQKDSVNYKMIMTPDSTLIHSIPYRGDVKHGLEKSYFSSGKVKEMKSWWKGTKFGHFFRYYDLIDTVIVSDTIRGSYLATKQRVKEYVYYDSGNEIFSVNFNKSQEVLNLRGHPILVNFDARESYNVGDTIEVKLKYAPLYFEKLYTEVYVLRQGESEYLTKTKKDVSTHIASFEYPLESAENVVFELKWKIEHRGKAYSGVTYLSEIKVKNTSLPQVAM